METLRFSGPMAILKHRQLYMYTSLKKKTQMLAYVYNVLLEKEMATLSSILAWKIPWAEEPGGIQSMGSQKSQTGLSD